MNEEGQLAVCKGGGEAVPSLTCIFSGDEEVAGESTFNLNHIALFSPILESLC
jgi:hypothetical protein